MKITNKIHNGKILANRKEKSFFGSYNLIAWNGNEMLEIANLRFYGKNRIHACFWLNDAAQGFHISGGGHTGGGGYDKVSVAAEAALNDAGIIFETSFGGEGDCAIKKALGSIANFIGYDNYLVTINFA